MFVIHYRNYFYTLSTLLIVASLAAFLYFGLNFSIEFTGGSLLEIAYEEEISAQDVRDSLAQAELTSIPALTNLQIQATEDNNMLLRFGPVDEQTHQAILTALSEATELRFESIGPVIGEELRVRTIWGLVFAIAGMFIYVGIAFRKISRIPSWKVSTAAILALLHDIIISAGGFIILSSYYSFEIGILFVTALLTVWGYSINDTIVVFDRVRENALKEGRSQLTDIIEHSIRQTISRSINTSVAVLILLGALFMAGPSLLTPFVAPLIIGVIIGTYSSIFLATPLLADLAS